MNLLPQEVIARKRDGHELGGAEIDAFVAGVVDGGFRDYQAAALLMAVVLRGMSVRERCDLTRAMVRSGRSVELPEIARPKVDKHSTGGVGDKVSLVLSPLAAAAGLCVPMMSGRGLGHTGGTLDKLEAIPGFRVDLDEARYRSQLAAVHCAMIGQSEDIVPADRILYALRDVTATVESIPLICASILSKKLAEGIDALVLDVKCGSGAFLPERAQARELAAALVDTSTALGKPCEAVLTDMEQPLGRSAGNAVEVAEAIDCLRGGGPPDLREISLELTARMLRLGGLVESLAEGRGRCLRALDGGDALEAFRRLVEAQGGDPRVVDDPARLPAAAVRELRFGRDTAAAPEARHVATVDARRVGEAVRLLGAGRRYHGDRVDPAAGVDALVRPGDAVAAGDLLCRMKGDPARFEEAGRRLLSAFTFTAEPPAPRRLILEVVEGACRREGTRD